MSVYSAPVVSDVLVSQPARGRTRWLKAIVLATVLGCNIAALAGVWAWTWQAEKAPSVAADEGFDGMMIALVALVIMATIVISLIIGLTVALTRFGRLGWLPPTTSAARAMLVGLRTAAWGLWAVLPIPVFFFTVSLI